MREILNLTQHVATADQVAAGVFDPHPEQAAQIQRLLTFDELPSREEIKRRATALAQFAKGERATVVMIGGAPWLMAELVDAMDCCDIEAVYAFSRREATEITRPDGTVEKRQIFRHAGFVTLWRHSRIAAD